MSKRDRVDVAAPRGRSRARFVVRLSLAALLPLAGAGCSFWGTEGAGSLSRATAFRFYGHAPKPLAAEDFQGHFQADAWLNVPREPAAVGANRATIRQINRRSWGAVPLIGYSTAENFIQLDKANGTGQLVGHSGFFLPAFPVAIIWCQAWDTWYSVERGSEYATRLYYGFGPAGIFGGYTRCVQPADIVQLSGNLLFTAPSTFGRDLAAIDANQGDECKYNSQWAWHILGGLIAWGRVNYDTYFQFAWIPIHIGRLHE